MGSESVRDAKKNERDAFDRASVWLVAVGKAWDSTVQAGWWLGRAASREFCRG